MLDWLANPGAVSVRHEGHDGAEDTPPASQSMICDALPLSSPAAPHAGLDLTTPERPIEHPSPPPEHPPATINVPDPATSSSDTPGTRISKP